MDILFAHHEVYRVNEPIEVVRDKVCSIADRKWSDFTENITGRLRDDDSFKFTHKWSFVVINGGGQPAYLSGKLMQDNGGTTIKITTRPNVVFVLLIYLITAIFLCELFGIDTFIEAPKPLTLLFFPFFNLILFGIMQILINGLKNRFKRLLNLKNKEQLLTTTLLW